MKLIKDIIRSTGKLFNHIWGWHAHETMSLFWRLLYSGWISREFAECGNNTVFGKFRTLIGGRHITIGNDCTIGKNIIWEVYDHFRDQTFSPVLSFGNSCCFGDDGHISCINKVQIGNGVRMGRKVFITDNSHGSNDARQLDIPANYRPLISKGTIIIGDNVWIGESVCILPGVIIGKGSIVGANAVVTKDVPPYTVVAGNPARVVKTIAKENND